MSRKARKDDSVDVVDEGLPWWRRPGRSAVLSLAASGGLLLITIAGLERLKARVDSLPEYNPTPKLQLVDPPDWVDRERWRPQILASIRLPEQPNWLDEGLARQIGQQLSESGWVSQVRRVTQDVDGNIRVWCDYRRPIAMLRTKQEGKDDCVYVAVDKDGVRLPQVYRDVDEAGWMQIVGVESPVPPAGQVFSGEDAVAAVKLAQLLSEQRFAPRIRILDVSNFRGRRNKRQDHIFLQARGWREPIAWGSAIGEEYEESHWLEKIRLIAKILEPGSPHVQANVSCFPDRVILKPAFEIETADSSQPRGR